MKKVPLYIPLTGIPIFITAIAFVIDLAKVSLYSFMISMVVVCAIFLLSYFVTGKIWAAWLLTSLPVFTVELINYYKLVINGAPLIISDFYSFGKNFKQILGFALPQINVSAVVVICIALFVIFSASLVLLEKTYRKHKQQRIGTGILGLVILLVLLLPLSSKVIAKSAIYNSSEELVLENGAVTGLYLSGIKSDNMAESELSIQTIKEITDAVPYNTEKGILPTVIFLMSESFFDVDRLPSIEFSKDPIPNFHKLAKNYSTGSLVSTTYCGGTGTVEMEFLTGICSALLKDKDTFDTLPEETYRKIPSVSDIFKAYGYKTKYVHSYNSSLYNRPVIYNAFGFDEVRFSYDFKQEIEKDGGYVSDKTLTREIISMYEETEGEPLMLYAVSMENHQPFLADKYDQKTDIEIYSEKLDDADKRIFESYIHGLNNADRALGELIEYFSKVQEPVMIVFWGDHLPNLTLGENRNVYNASGYSPLGESYEWQGEDLLKMLKTDYVIWDNFALDKTDKTIGGVMLGVEIAERLELNMPDYFKWLSKYIKDDFLVYRRRIFATSENEVYDSIVPQYQKMMDDYKQVVYDIIYGENELFAFSRE